MLNVEQLVKTQKAYVQELKSAAHDLYLDLYGKNVSNNEIAVYNLGLSQVNADFIASVSIQDDIFDMVYVESLGYCTLVSRIRG